MGNNNPSVEVLTVIDINRFSTSSRNGMVFKKGDLSLNRLNLYMHFGSSNGARHAFWRPSAVEALEETLQPASNCLDGYTDQED